MEFRQFEPTLFQFLKQLAKNNNRPWFLENKPRYENEVLEPSLAFIRAFRPRLKKISEFFVASDRRVGGSLMRVYRDTRFWGKEEPYKTNVGIQFRHEFGKDIHAPGFYLHLEPGIVFWPWDYGGPIRCRCGRSGRRSSNGPFAGDARGTTRNSAAASTLDGGSLKKCPLGFPVDHPLHRRSASGPISSPSAI